MLTVQQLRQYANQFKHGEERPVSIFSTNSIIKNKTITIKGEARGTKSYPITIVFFNADYSLEPDSTHPLTVRTKMGEKAYMTPLSETTNPVQVRCGCPSYAMRFAHWNKENKALTGAPFPTYIRKTVTRPEINSSHSPGICKHIIAFLDKLRGDKILQ